MNLKINLLSKPHITFSKCRTRDNLFKLLSGICIGGEDRLNHVFYDLGLTQFSEENSKNKGVRALPAPPYFWAHTTSTA